MATRSRAGTRPRSKRFLVQQPHGQLTDRVQQVGPEHFVGAFTLLPQIVGF
jgi:hypothetical protein